MMTQFPRFQIVVGIGAGLPFFALFGLTVLGAPASTESDWPNWRGPHLTGAIHHGEYPTHLDSTQLVWKVELPGKGSSTPIVWKDRIFVTAPVAGQDAVLAFDWSGKEVWQTKLGKELAPKHQTLGSSCNASPVTDGQHLFVYFKSGNFACLGMDGTVRWQTNLVQRFGGEQLFWDQGTSPVLTDDYVVVARMHGGDSWLAGFDKRTGALQWQQSRNYQTPTENNNAYSTPLLFEENGRPSLLLWGADHLTSHDAANGKLKWACDGFNPKGTGFWPAIATPVLAGDLAIVPVGRDDRRQGSLYAVRLGGSGDVTATHRAWSNQDVGVFVCSPAQDNGRIYLLRHRGEVACLNAADGRLLWSEALPRDKSSYYASPVVANSLLYAAREDGTVFVVRVQDRFELLSQNPLGERIVASPVPAGNRLLIRGDQHLFCFTSSEPTQRQSARN